MIDYFRQQVKNMKITCILAGMLMACLLVVCLEAQKPDRK